MKLTSAIAAAILAYCVMIDDVAAAPEQPIHIPDPHLGWRLAHLGRNNSPHLTCLRNHGSWNKDAQTCNNQPKAPAEYSPITVAAVTTGTSLSTIWVKPASSNSTSTTTVWVTPTEAATTRAQVDAQSSTSTITSGSTRTTTSTVFVQASDAPYSQAPTSTSTSTVYEAPAATTSDAQLSKRHHEKVTEYDPAGQLLECKLKIRHGKIIRKECKNADKKGRMPRLQDPPTYVGGTVNPHDTIEYTPEALDEFHKGPTAPDTPEQNEATQASQDDGASSDWQVGKREESNLDKRHHEHFTEFGSYGRLMECKVKTHHGIVSEKKCKVAMGNHDMGRLQDPPVVVGNPWVDHQSKRRRSVTAEDDASTSDRDVEDSDSGDDDALSKRGFHETVYNFRDNGEMYKCKTTKHWAMRQHHRCHRVHKKHWKYFVGDPNKSRNYPAFVRKHGELGEHAWKRDSTAVVEKSDTAMDSVQQKPENSATDETINADDSDSDSDSDSESEQVQVRTAGETDATMATDQQEPKTSANDETMDADSDSDSDSDCEEVQARGLERRDHRTTLETDLQGEDWSCRMHMHGDQITKKKCKALNPKPFVKEDHSHDNFLDVNGGDRGSGHYRRSDDSGLQKRGHQRHFEMDGNGQLWKCKYSIHKNLIVKKDCHAASRSDQYRANVNMASQMRTNPYATITEARVMARATDAPKIHITQA